MTTCIRLECKRLQSDFKPAYWAAGQFFNTREHFYHISSASVGWGRSGEWDKVVSRWPKSTKNVSNGYLERSLSHFARSMSVLTFPTRGFGWWSSSPVPKRRATVAFVRALIGLANARLAEP